MAAWYVVGTRAVLSAVWPARCVGCGCPNTWWCVGCDLTVVHQPRLLRRSGSALQGIAAGGRYVGPFSSLIKALKYRHARAVAPVLASYLIRPLSKLRTDQAVLVPIPLHPLRERKRGHNQSALLAHHLSIQARIPVATALERTKPTVSQTGLGRADRRRNVRGAFRWNKRFKVRPTVILVDDVCTTGATLESAAAACQAAGVETMWGLVAARR